MKKLIPGILSFLLVWILCGCEASSGDSQPTEPTAAPTVISENGDGEAVALEYDMAIPMTFLSDFTLYLDSDMNFVFLEAAGEEGKQLLEGIDLSGKSYAEIIASVLQNAQQQGLFTHGEEIHFTFSCENISSALMENLFLPVVQFIHDNSVYVHINWEVIPEEEPDFEANYLYATQKTTENGQTVYIDRWETARPSDGVKYTHYNIYSKFPDRTIYNGGPLITGNNLDPIRNRILIFRENGEWAVTYFKDGYQTKSVMLYDGRYEVYEYENRAQTRWTTKNDTSFIIWNEHNHAILSIYTYANEMQGVSTYHSNGNLAREANYSDGIFSQRIYDENGQWTYSDG